jgi:formamidopyrimidine-DNA glycosylase
MPELPEVEVLVRHLAPLLEGRRVRDVRVRRPRVIRPAGVVAFRRALVGATFVGLTRRGKYLLFTLRRSANRSTLCLVGHLGMTGRMYVQPVRTPLPKHAAVVFALGPVTFVCEDTRYFGRLSLDTRALSALGPEPLEPAFTSEVLARGLARSRQAIKVKLLDQSLVAGIGNIYASEALFAARVSPQRAACKLSAAQVRNLWRSLRRVLAEAVAWGSTVPLDWRGPGHRDGLFYYGLAAGAPDYYVERLRVYDRVGQPCPRCRAAIRRLVQAGRSTFFCPRCQR